LKENKEIKALLQLMDDPDEDVYHTVSNKIISFGKEIIPNLEGLWEHSINENLQERIKQLIHQLHFKDLTTAFEQWHAAKGSLLDGAMLVSKYQYPDLERVDVDKELEKLRRNTWLELNNYLTALEEVNVFNSILFSYYKQKGVEISYSQPEDFFLNKAIQSKKGNAISNGILYLILCEMLDIPVKAVNVPRQFLLAYVDIQQGIIHPNAHNSEKLKFFIDPMSGQIYSHKDVENYFKRIAVPPTTSYFKELSNTSVIKFLLEEVAKCFNDDANRYKMQELLTLAKLLEE